MKTPQHTRWKAAGVGLGTRACQSHQVANEIAPRLLLNSTLYLFLLFVFALQVVRDTLKKIGYDAKEKGIDYRTCNVVVALEEQSPDIAQSVVGQNQERTVEQIGAGDQVRGNAHADTHGHLIRDGIQSSSARFGVATTSSQSLLAARGLHGWFLVFVVLCRATCSAMRRMRPLS